MSDNKAKSSEVKVRSKWPRRLVIISIVVVALVSAIMIGYGRSPDVLAIFGDKVISPGVVQSNSVVEEVRVTAIFGTVEVRLPPAVSVGNGVKSIFGTLECTEICVEPSGVPDVQVDGLAYFGTVRIVQGG